jgi:hypothetical protein
MAGSCYIDHIKVLVGKHILFLKIVHTNSMWWPLGCENK